jgi:hypothetical protein
MTKSAIIISFVALLAFNFACTPPKNCDDTLIDLTVSATAFTSTPNAFAQVKNVPFVMTVTNCDNFRGSFTKSDTLLSNDKGRVDTIYKGLKKACNDAMFCQPKVEINALTPLNFVRWGSNVVNNSYEFKERTVLKVQIRHDLADVSELFLSASQKGQFTALQLVDTRTNATNKAPFNFPLFFNIAKGEDAQLNIQFDKKLVRTDTIKASQLDTIFRTIIL